MIARGGMHNGDVPLGSKAISILVAAQFYRIVETSLRLRCAYHPRTILTRNILAYTVKVYYI